MIAKLVAAGVVMVGLAIAALSMLRARRDAQQRQLDQAFHRHSRNSGTWGAE